MVMQELYDFIPNHSPTGIAICIFLTQDYVFPCWCFTTNISFLTLHFFNTVRLTTIISTVPGVILLLLVVSSH